jgi:hypothetical protein
MARPQPDLIDRKLKGIGSCSAYADADDLYWHIDPPTNIGKYKGHVKHLAAESTLPQQGKTGNGKEQSQMESVK